MSGTTLPSGAFDGTEPRYRQGVGIPDEDVAQVRAQTDIVALIGEHAALKRVGRRWTGLCPFHTEKTPSFSVNAEEGFYYCFGCQASGDAITFVREMEHLDFVDAVRLLADRAGVALHEDAEVGKDRKRRVELLEALERAVVWYHERLLRAPDAGPARDYLRSRGYDGDVVRRFRLGWAPDDWDALSRALKLSDRVLTDSGLGFVNKRGRAQDAFRARVLFPICDPSGRPVALEDEGGGAQAVISENSGRPPGVDQHESGCDPFDAMLSGLGFKVPIEWLHATVESGAIMSLGLQFLDRECHFKCRVRFRASALVAARRLVQTVC